MDPFHGRRLQDIRLEDIQSLVDDRVPESLHLDYKQELELKEPRQKKDFLCDVTAFANAEGGLLLYGVAEQRDASGRSTGVPASAGGFSGENSDSLVQRVENLLRVGIDERLPPCEISVIESSEESSILLLRVPQSLRPPHMVVLDGEHRFHIRVNGGNERMSTSQLRDSVLRTQSMNERVRKFVKERVATLKEQLPEGPYWAMHLIPLVPAQVDFDVTRTQTIDILREIGVPQNPQAFHHCLEGYRMLRAGPSGELTGMHAFRDGTLEFFDQLSMFNKLQERQVNGEMVYTFLERYLERGLSLYRSGNLSVPVAVCITFAEVTGLELPDERNMTPLRGTSKNISSEPFVVTDPNTDSNSIMNPFLNVFWNAFGHPRCSAYHEDGSFRGFPD